MTLVSSATPRTVRLFLFLIRRAPLSTLFPYTTLFRSLGGSRPPGAGAGHPRRGGPARPHHQRDTGRAGDLRGASAPVRDRKSTRLNSSHPSISYAVFCSK